MFFFKDNLTALMTRTMTSVERDVSIINNLPKVSARVLNIKKTYVMLLELHIGIKQRERGRCKCKFDALSNHFEPNRLLGRVLAPTWHDNNLISRSLTCVLTKKNHLTVNGVLEESGRWEENRKKQYQTIHPSLAVKCPFYRYTLPHLVKRRSSVKLNYILYRVWFPPSSCPCSTYWSISRNEVVYCHKISNFLWVLRLMVGNKLSYYK